MRPRTAIYILSFLFIAGVLWAMFRLLCCCLGTQEGREQLNGELQAYLSVLVAAAMVGCAMVAFDHVFWVKGRLDLDRAEEEEEAVVTVATQTESQPPEDRGGQGGEALLRIQRLLEEFCRAVGPLVRESEQRRSLAAAGGLTESLPEGAPSC